jgi:ribose-phosphate pyrophosphokinase
VADSRHAQGDDARAGARETAALFALAECGELAAQVSREASLTLAPLEERRFEGGEFKLRPLESVRGRAAFVLESLAGTSDAPVTHRLVRLLFLLNVLRDAGASRRVALLPYLAFARKERRTQPRDPVNTRYLAELIESAGADRVVALDVHSPAAFDNSFRIPTDHLSASPMMVDHFAARLAGAGIAVLSPDVGGVKRAQIFRELLEARIGREVELGFLEKRRARGVVSGGTLVGDVRGREVIVLDDLCATGGTLIRAAAACRRAGAERVHVTVTHAPLASGVSAVLSEDTVASMLVTDSAADAIPRGGFAGPHGQKMTVLSIAPLLGQAIRRMLEGRPLAPLLTRWPPAPED